jgi:hypothetical protein
MTSRPAVTICAGSLVAVMTLFSALGFTRR